MNWTYVTQGQRLAGIYAYAHAYRLVVISLFTRVNLGERREAPLLEGPPRASLETEAAVGDTQTHRRRSSGMSRTGLPPLHLPCR